VCSDVVPCLKNMMRTLGLSCVVQYMAACNNGALYSTVCDTSYTVYSKRTTTGKVLREKRRAIMAEAHSLIRGRSDDVEGVVVAAARRDRHNAAVSFDDNEVSLLPPEAKPSSCGHSLASSGQSSVVDPALSIEAERSTASRAVTVTLQDLKKIIERDERFSEVTVEQIERVRKMRDKIFDGASFSFNYNTLILVASVLAGLGLVSNATATIIASMLVSPIMGKNDAPCRVEEGDVCSFFFFSSLVNSTRFFFPVSCSQDPWSVWRTDLRSATGSS